MLIVTANEVKNMSTGECALNPVMRDFFGAVLTAAETGSIPATFEVEERMTTEEEDSIKSLGYRIVFNEKLSKYEVWV